MGSKGTVGSRKWHQGGCQSSPATTKHICCLFALWGPSTLPSLCLHKEKAENDNMRLSEFSCHHQTHQLSHSDASKHPSPSSTSYDYCYIVRSPHHLHYFHFCFSIDRKSSNKVDFFSFVRGNDEHMRRWLPHDQSSLLLFKLHFEINYKPYIWKFFTKQAPPPQTPF